MPHLSSAAAKNGTAERTKVHLTGAPRTMLGTLMMRAMDARAAKPILGDTHALATVDAIDVDWADYFGRIRASAFFNTSIALRARRLDAWTREFLTRHDEATVLHLACGLDARCLRVVWQRPNAKVRWIDVDVPEVVAVRRAVPHLNPASSGAGDYTLLGTSVIDDTWLEKQVPNDRPVAIVMEGLIMYLPRPHGNLLLYRFAAHFPLGGQVMFDSVGPGFVSLLHMTAAFRPLGFTLGWMVDDPYRVEDVHPRFKVLEVQSLYRPEDKWRHFSWIAISVMWLLSWVPYLGVVDVFMIRMKF